MIRKLMHLGTEVKKPEFVMRRSNFAGFVSHDLNGARSHDANEHGCACEVAGFFATYVSTCAWAA